jgi:hypothetical protein
MRRTGLTMRSVPAQALTDHELEEIWALYSRFVERPKAPFLEGVRRTDDVFVGRDAHGALRAFAAAKALDVEWRGVTYGVLIAAWGGIDPAFRGGHIIQLAGFATYLKYKRRHPLRPTYFAMMSSTYKSYLLLTRNFTEYWPNRRAATPERERALLDVVMRRIGGSDWDPAAGVVRRYGALRYLEGVVADERDQGDPDVAFYGTRNPRQSEGDSLACLAPLSLKNWIFMAWRGALRTLRTLRRSRRHT